VIIAIDAAQVSSVRVERAVLLLLKLLSSPLFILWNSSTDITTRPVGHALRLWHSGFSWRDSEHAVGNFGQISQNCNDRRFAMGSMRIG
jgi:hypothetical protein